MIMRSRVLSCVYNISLRAPNMQTHCVRTENNPLNLTSEHVVLCWFNLANCVLVLKMETKNIQIKS